YMFGIRLGSSKQEKDLLKALNKEYMAALEIFNTVKTKKLASSVTKLVIHSSIGEISEVGKIRESISKDSIPTLSDSGSSSPASPVYA
nr:hypothetical protein [Gammaproteobacteria bacterium]